MPQLDAQQGYSEVFSIGLATPMEVDGSFTIEFVGSRVRLVHILFPKSFASGKAVPAALRPSALEPSAPENWGMRKTVLTWNLPLIQAGSGHASPGSADLLQLF